MEDKIIGTGFLPPVFEPEAYFLGSSPIPQKVLEPLGDWTDSLPTDEPQSLRGIETSNCTAFGTTNQIEQYEFKAFGERNNYSDRWLGIVAGTTPVGNDPQKVYEAVRKFGLIPEAMLPFRDDFQTAEEYYSFKGADMDACYVEGKRWLEQKSFLHEWVFGPDATNKPEKMKTALQYSPLALAVNAWTLRDGKYVAIGNENHWTTCFNFNGLEKIFDSYDPFRKIVDQPVHFCKRIHLEKRTPKGRRWFQRWIQEILR